MTTILLISYVVLFSITYYIMKQLRKIVPNGDDWESVFVTIVVSLICPIGIFLSIYGYLYMSDTKPPKWL